MNDFIEWLRVGLRWVHVFAVILWIGNTYLFNFMEKSLEHDADTPEDVRGRLWMVHGGGFYFVEKQIVLKGKPRVLHWFKWEAAIAFISGALLLTLDYYYGGLLVEPEMSYSHGAIAGLTCILGGWVVYDFLVRSPIGKHEIVLAAIGWCAFVGIAYVLGRYLAPRAVYIHIGAMIGTIMAANVWMRILPASRRMLASIDAGKMPEADAAATGPLRSKQNSYMVIPLVLLMISNHYPIVHGSRYNWLILGVVLIIGWTAARMFRGPTKPGEGAPIGSGPASGGGEKSGEKGPAKTPMGPGPVWHAAVGIGLLAVGLGVGLHYSPAHAAEPTHPATSGGAGTASAKPAPTGDAVVQGVVRFEGQAPAPEEWGGAHHAECKRLHSETIELVRVKDGKLADAFVYVSSGLPEGTYPVPKTAVHFDQLGCEFTPRVFGVMAGQDIDIGNGDRLLHNVHSPGFNQAFAFGAKLVKTLDEPEVMATMKCDVHPWMRGYAGVMEHPYFAVTGEDGRFSIGGLPEGQYEISAWHEKLGTQKTSLKASEKEPQHVELVFKAAP